MLSIWYDDPDAGPVDITGSVKYGIGQIKLQTKAEQGAVATSSIIVEDPDGIYDFRGLRRIWVNESDADFERLYTGWVWGKSYTRGDYYRTGAARQITVELQDLNHLLWQKIMAGSDTARPSESDVTRMQWLLATNEAAIVIDDTTTYMFTDAPVTMDANPSPGYNGQTFQNVVDDCAQDSGKNYYMLDVFDGYDYVAGIWYGLDGLDEFVSDATISNVESEVDNVTVFWSDIGANLDKDPSRVFSGIFGNFDGGWTYQVNSVTEDNFANRDTTASWPNVKTQAKAAARAQRQLSTINFEEEAVTCTIYSMLPSQANVFRAGMRVNGVKFTHFPGWEEGRDCRIVTKTITDQAEGLYSVELELLPILPPPTCAVTLASVQWSDSGLVVNTTGPIALGPPTMPSAALYLAGNWVSEGTGFLFGTYGLGAGYTEIDRNTPGSTHTWVETAYSASPSATFTMSSFNGSGGDPCSQSMILGVPTNATAPVQNAFGDSASTVTFSSPVTAGNLVVMFTFGEHQTFPTPDPPDLYLDGILQSFDWTKIYRVDSSGGTIGLNGFTMAIYAFCAPSSFNEVSTGSGAFAHWASVVEVALT